MDYAEDITVGETRRFGKHSVSEAELVDFAREWDPQSFHIDRAAAESGVYGGLIASGIHTLAIGQRLAVDAVYAQWHVIAGRRLVEVRFLRPVRVGDTLSGTNTVREVAVDDKGRAQVANDVVLVNQADKPVLSMTVEVLVRARPGADTARGPRLS
ncbi:MaoC/PaaZ C-terminal domain-containing protein [Gordonia soli]|uniref:MaoC-like domain-containing protein n=1 Tax=Gordonia soli NBRC 108243 TaxID=1223545 RepID=M0QMF2_9ACTN|nr:MaoC/PaaZ C-terminal domain-containing protein [Gordonia soli]GAC68587.1 hypothetical protein GS4_16_01180 [Gordonia soli NBRC 108243]